MPEISRNFSFDAGIERIVTRDDFQPASLPDAARVVPGDGIYLQQLQEVLFPPSLEESLAEAFRPDVANRDVLTPGGYQGAVDGAVGDLRAAAAKATDPAEKAKLETALAVLKDDASLRDLLNTYRHLLHKA